MNNNRITVSKKGLVIIGIILLLGAMFLAISHSDAKPQPDSCTEAKAEGLYNIPRSSPYYRPSLDRDRDGLACEL